MSNSGHAVHEVYLEDMSWASRKFTKFLVDNARDNLWTEDDLFRSLKEFLPDKADYEETLKKIYIARGKQTHAGHGYPSSSGIGVFRVTRRR